jgi:hypothetical protein
MANIQREVTIMANDEDKKGVNPVVASLAGAALGAAVGAGAIILSDKKNRKKLEEVLEGLKKQGFNVLDIVQREAETVKNKLDSGKAEKTKKQTKSKKKS